MRLSRFAIVLILISVSPCGYAQVQSIAVPPGSSENWNKQPTALPPSVLGNLSRFNGGFQTTSPNLSSFPDMKWNSPQSVDHLVFGDTSVDVKQKGIAIIRAEAAAGDAEAKLRLGAAYEFGLGTDKDPSSAFVNYLEAARENNSASQYAVGRAYLSGIGTDPNFLQSFTWLNSAYGNGQTEAAMELAKAYQFGVGTSENVDKSELYWQEALRLNSPDVYLGYASFLVDKKAKSPADDAVKNLIWKAADLGDPLALSAAFDIAVSTDDKARQGRWIDKLREQSEGGNITSSLELADAYLTQGSPHFSPVEALGLYKAAAMNGNAYAQAKYGGLLLRQPALDNTVLKDDVIAMINQAAARGQPDALLDLADIAREKHDLRSAYAYAASASELGGAKYSESAKRIQLSVCAEMVDEVCQPVPVFYITNRAELGKEPLAFANRLAPDRSLTMGHSLVSIPTKRAVETEQRSMWKILASYIGFGSNNPSHSGQRPAKGDVANFAYDGSLESFLDSVQQAGVDNGRNKIIVFIHGFANTFEDATRRMAILSESQKYPGIPIVLSWASAGESSIRLGSGGGYTGLGYNNDLLTVGQSCRGFKNVLEKVVERFGAANVTVFAHSMGAQLVDYMLSGCPNYPVPWSGKDKIGNLVFAAPDVDLSNFVDHVDSLRSATDSFTIYVSANDMALRASQEAVGGRRRLGQGGSDRYVAEEIVTIDATTVEVEGGLNHSFVFDVAQVRRDLSDLFRGNTDPSSRACPKAYPDERSPSLKYWIIQPSCTE
ncbi:alpha/beta hydrolase [Rhizobium sp. NRK18]|uniref:alpha/beta hydrolase n=1 Tax=Rhizobium sp. NRK18 TaxID=2964667 RepID=UPI0021C413C2|nr:alpha/beta hydrolase [Rhizobium sp. NRK18]MCQ2005111.1 alpha/beta hydrolase [Rhizobium sp. NRK18]